MATVVGPKGQVVIEKEIRDRLGIQPGTLAIQRLANDHVEIHFIPPAHRRSLRGALAAHISNTVPPEAWAEARERAWQEAAAEQPEPDAAGEKGEA